MDLRPLERLVEPDAVSGSAIRSEDPASRSAPWLVVGLEIFLAGCAAVSPPAATPTPATSASPIPTLMVCQPSEPSCIGPLAPGVHTTVNLITPVTIEFPDGWSRTLDVPGSAQFESSTFPTGSIGIRPDWAIANQERCTSDPEPDLGRTVEDLVTWLTEHPGLITSTPSPASLGGFEGQVLDVWKDPDWSGPCAGRVSLFTHVGTINDPGWWDVNDTARLRLYFLAAGGDRVVTVHVETTDEADFERFVEAATPILESFDFGAAP